MSIEGIFVKEDDVISVKVLMAQGEGKLIVGEEMDVLRVFKPDVKEEDVHEETFVFRRPKFVDMPAFMDGAMAINNEEEFSLSPGSQSLSIFKRLIKSWTITNGDGESVPVNEENIQSLNPSVAQYVINQLNYLIGN